MLSLSKSFEHLIGIPFVDGGRTPDEGLDCLGLFILVNKEYGIAVPDHKVSCYNTLAITYEALKRIKDSWEKIDEPVEGCGVAFAIDPAYPGLVQHLGVYIGDGKVIHTIQKAQSSLLDVNHTYWKNKIIGYYRWKQEK